MDMTEKVAEVEAVFEEFKGMALSLPSKSVKYLPVNGHDVMRIIGCKPGPKVGEVLNDLFERVVNGELPEDRHQLLMAVGADNGNESISVD